MCACVCVSVCVWVGDVRVCMCVIKWSGENHLSAPRGFLYMRRKVVINVDIAMSHVQVTRDNHRLPPHGLLSLDHVLSQVGVPCLHAVVESFEVLPRVDHVEGEHCEIFVFDGDAAPFGVGELRCVYVCVCACV